MKNNQMSERIKDLKYSNPSTVHPVDFELQDLGLVLIKDGLTFLVDSNFNRSL